MSLELSKKALSIKASSTMAITAQASEMKYMGYDVVSFGAGEPDFATPEHICEAAKRAIDDGYTKYTDAAGMFELREVISHKFHNFNHLDYAPDQIVVSNGGKHSLTNAFTAIINDGDEVLIPAPYWVSYPAMTILAGGVPVIVKATKENSYKVTVEQLEAAATDKTKALVINSPNNPTGMIYSRAELEAIADFAIRHDIFVISDEIYEGLFYTEERHVSIASLSDEMYKRTITVNGLAKSYAMTGWRIGYAGAPKEIAVILKRIQSQQASNPNSIAQKAAVAAIAGDQTCVREMNQAYNSRRKYIYNRVINIKYLSAVEPHGAFYVFVDATEMFGKKYKGQEIKTAADIAKFLLDDYYVAIVPCADFGFDDHFRLSYATSQERIEEGMNRIEDFANSLTD